MEDIPDSIIKRVRIAKFFSRLGLLISIITFISIAYLTLYTNESIIAPTIIGVGTSASIILTSKKMLKNVAKDLIRLEYE